MVKVTDETGTGNPESWESVIEKYNEKLKRYAYKLTGDSVEAEDVVQETIRRVLSTNATPISNYAYWKKTVRNVFLDKWKKNQVVSQISFDDREHKELHNQLVGDNPIKAIEDALYYEELYRSLPLQIILSGLSENELELLYMYAVDEMSAKEIAAALGEDVDHIRYKMNRIYSKIRYRVRQLSK